jgi:hypothetical protein
MLVQTSQTNDSPVICEEIGRVRRHHVRARMSQMTYKMSRILYVRTRKCSWLRHVLWDVIGDIVCSEYVFLNTSFLENWNTEDALCPTWGLSLLCWIRTCHIHCWRLANYFSIWPMKIRNTVVHGMVHHAGEIQSSELPCLFVHICANSAFHWIRWLLIPFLCVLRNVTMSHALHYLLNLFIYLW